MNNLLACLVLVLVFSVVKTKGDPLVPALIIFGDSVVDVGNNNNINTPITENFPPYGRDFVTSQPEDSAMESSPQTSLLNTSGSLHTHQLTLVKMPKKVLSSLELTSLQQLLAYMTELQTYRAVRLSQQLNYYKEYQTKVVNIVGKPKANEIVSGAIHLLSAGSSDYIQNYYINPLLNRVYSPDQFTDILIKSYSTFIQNLYGLEARRIGVTTLPPTGCLPAAITLFGRGSNQCVARLNQDAIAFNNKLNSTPQSLQEKMPDLKLVVFDIYQPLLNMVTKPAENGF